MFGDKTGKQTKDIKHAGFWQLIKFGLVGVCNTVVSYTVYSVCYHVFHTGVHMANIMGFVISVFTAFLLQSRFVFAESEEGEHRVWWQVLIKTYIAYAFTGLFLTEVLLIFWLDVMNIKQYLMPVIAWMRGYGWYMKPEDLAASIAPFLNMAFTIPINFCVNKFWAYRQRKK